MILTLSARWISVSFTSFLRSEATERSRCSRCRAYSFWMSASTLAVSVWKKQEEWSQEVFIITLSLFHTLISDMMSKIKLIQGF